MDWNSVKTKSYSSNQSTDLFFKLQPGEKAVVRPIGRTWRVSKYLFMHNGEYKSAICLDPSNCPVAKRHNVRPKDRIIILIIDRRDNKVKVFESSPYAFSEMKKYKKKTNKHPGAEHGAEFEIYREDTGKTYYKMKYKGPHILSDEDIKLVKDNLINIPKLYKATHPDEIENVLFGDNIDLDSDIDRTNPDEDPMTDDELEDFLSEF